MKIIPLRPFAKGLFTIVDDDNYDLLAQIRWVAARRYHSEKAESKYDAVYNKRIGKIVKHYRMARLIMNPPSHLQIDHINRNSLDNRKENLRLSTGSQNAYNSKLPKNNKSGYKGVAFQSHNPTNPWRTFINIDKKKKHIGYFSTPIEAAEAYDEAAIKYYGEYAATNKMLGLL